MRTRSLLRRLAVALALLLVVSVLFVRLHGVSRVPQQWWYPFIPSLFSGHYTAGPFAMTSNTREDNPAWSGLAAFNLTQARLAYAATRGTPQAQVAWLLPEAHWKDEPVFSFLGLRPNVLESQASKALTAGGFEYDRVSRRDLGAATAEGSRLVVGHARYDALLVTGLAAASPELLENIAALAGQGVPVVWLGAFPERATGWADHARRDDAVLALVRELRARVSLAASNSELATALGAAGVRATLAPVDGEDMRLRLHGRQAGKERFILLFNEAAHAVTGRYVTGEDFERAEMLDPETGGVAAIEVAADPRPVLEITVPAKRTRVLHLSAAAGEAREDSSAAAAYWNLATWQAPPRELYPFVRWWWPGNAVDAEELRRELQSLHAAGFGGVELQTLTLGFTQEQLLRHRERIYQVGTPDWFANVRVVFEEAQRLGMRVDLTLGSGWSSGGPFIERHPEQQLLRTSVDVTGPGQIDIAVPAAAEPAYVGPSNRVIRNTIGRFDTAAVLERVIASRVDTATIPETLTEFADISNRVSGGRIGWDVPAGTHRIFAIYRNATAHNAAGSAYPGALERAPILDHLDRGGVEEYIEKLGEPWLLALEPFRPDAIFVDSFELIAELPWSRGFEAAFRDMHGYELAPYLPLVFRRDGESKYMEAFAAPAPAYRSSGDMAERVREDYEATREALFLGQFLRPLKQWSAGKGVQLRLQAHGGYGDYLDSYQVADVPEAEGLFAGGSFDFLKLASSAAHVAGRPVVSSESFINLVLDYNALTIDDYHWLAGNAFAAGINRTVCHGYAYHFPVRD